MYIYNFFLTGLQIFDKIIYVHFIILSKIIHMGIFSLINTENHLNLSTTCQIIKYHKQILNKKYQFLLNEKNTIIIILCCFYFNLIFLFHILFLTKCYIICCRYDFFLVSQHVRQGTVTPTHYHVIEDTLKFPPDIMQKLTYKLTHMYYNWSVSI